MRFTHKATSAVPLAAICAFAAVAANAIDIDPENYGKSMSIKPASGKLSSTLANFPLLVRLSAELQPGFDPSECGTNGEDLRFALADGTLLSHEIDTWDASGESLVWVNIPSISSATKIFAFWDVKDAALAQPVTPSDAWPDFVAVYHLGEGGPIAYDSSGNGYDATNASTVAAASSPKIGGCTAVTSPNDGTSFFTLGVTDMTAPTAAKPLGDVSSVTFSGWVAADSRQIKDSFLSISRHYTGWDDGKGGYDCRYFPGYPYFGIYINSGPSSSDMFNLNTTAPASDGGWLYLTCTFNGVTSTKYVNGALLKNGAQTKSHGLFATTVPTAYQFGASKMNGRMDEVRVRNGTATAAWIAADYAQQTDEGFLDYAMTAAGDCPFGVTWEGTTNLAMTAATTVYVHAGRTNSIDCLSGAYMLTKLGEGTLEIHYVKTTGVQLDIAKGAVHFANPRPDDVFADASIHLDATDLASLDIVAANGTNYVRQWRDTDGRDRWATNCTVVSGNRTDPNRLAFRHVDGTGRRPVVDFGALLETSSTFMSTAEALALSYGAAMTLDSQVNMVEGYTVFSDTEDYDVWPTLASTTVRGQSLMSNPTTGWSRGTVAANGTPWAADGNPSNYYIPQSTSWTNIVLDLALVTGSTARWTNVPKGFHLARVVPAIPLPVTHLAAQSVWKSVVYGGQKIGEYVLFDHRLSQEDSDAVSYYLMAKWFPQTFAGVRVHAGASLLVDDDVALAPGYFSDDNETAEFRAGRGTTIFDPLSGGNVLLRLDASATNRMEIVRENGTNFVARWYDANGLSVHTATNMSPGKLNHRTNPERRMPFLAEGCSATGLPAVDFGTPRIYQQSKTATEIQSEITGYGASMILSKNISVGQFILVAEDNPAITNRARGLAGVSYLAYNGYTPTSGNFTGGNACRRGYTGIGLNAEIFGNYEPFSGGTHYVDGVSSTRNKRPPLGRFYVLDATPTYAPTLNRIARTIRMDSQDVTDSYGGMRFAELLLFKTRLPERERERAYRLMRTKWFGDDYVQTVHGYANLAVPADGEMTVAHDPVAVSGTLEIGGTLAVPEGLSAATVEVTAAGAEIAAPMTLTGVAELSFTQDGNGFNTLKVTSLVLSDAGVVRLSVTDSKALRHRKVKLVDCAAVTGSLDHWRASVAGWIHGAALFLEPDGIYAELLDPATILMVR